MKTKLLLLFQILTLTVLAQAPKLINYQGIARDSIGNPLPNKTLKMTFELLQGSGQTSVFTETQTVNTNSLGLFTTQIGKINTTGLDAVDFEGGVLALKIGVDPNGGNNFFNLGTQTLVSVPFSMHAQSVPVTYTNNVLTIGKTSFTLNGTGAIYTASTGISIVSNSVITNTAPDQTVTMTPGNSNVNITGTYPDFTVSASPSITLIAPTTLSISNGNTVDITPGLTFSNGILSVGNVNNTVSIPGATTSLVGSGAANVATLGVNSFSIDVPQPTLTVIGNSLSINGGNTVTLPSTPNTSVVGGGAVSVATIGVNSYSVSAAVPSLAISGNSLNIIGSNTVVLPSSPNTSLVGTGAANVATIGINSYSINVPNPTITPGTNVTVGGAYPNFTISATPTLAISGNSLSINGGNTVSLPAAPPQSLTLLGANTLSITNGNSVTIAPTLVMSGNTLQVGPATNTVVIPSGTFVPLVIVPMGVATGTQTGNTYSLEVAPSSVVITTLQAATSVTTLSPNNFSINIQPPVSQSLTMLSANTLSITGGNSVTLPSATAQSLAVNGQSLNITGANTITLPSASVVGTGAANVVTVAPNSYSIDVPVPNLTISGNSLSVNGGNTVTLPSATAQSLAVNGQSLNITGANTITLPSASVVGTGAANVVTIAPNSYSINVPVPNLSISGNSLSVNGGNTVTLPTAAAQSLAVNGQSLNITGANTITLPSASVVGTGAANVVTIAPNSYSINVPVPNLSISGNSLSVNGGNTVTLPTAAAQSLAVNGQSLNITGANTITLPSASVVGTGAANVVTLAPNSYSIDVPVPNLAISGNSLSVNGGNTVTLPTAAAQSLAVNGQSLNITGANTITLPSASVVGTGAANVVTLAPNSYSIDVPVPNLTISGNSLSVNGGNTVTLPTAAAQSLAVNGQSLNITGANTITLPTASIVGTGAANVATLGLNSYSIDVPQANLALSGNSLSISGGNTVTIAPTLAMSGNTLQVGPPTNTIMIPPAPVVALTPTGGGINITPSGTNSFVLDVPSTTLVPGTNVTINGAHPLYTVNATPTLNLVGNLLTISGGNAITLPSNTIAAVSVSIVQGGAVTVNTVGPNSYSISSEFPTVSMIAPNTLSVNTGGSVTIAPSLSVTGNVLTVGPATNTIALPSATTQSLAVNGQSLNITGANTITLPSASVVGTGAANVVTLAPNSYSINVPVPNLSISGNSLSVNGGNTVTLPSATAQSLAVNGQSLNITGANTITLPSASVVGTGAANVVTLAPNSYSINVPVPNLSISGNSLSVNGGNTVTLPTAAAQSLAVNGQSLNITGANTITLPSASVVGTGAANVVTIAPNSYSINVPTPNLTVTGNSLSVNGGNTVTLPTAAAQSLAVNGQSLNITGANTITLPSASVVGTGAANVVTLAPNSYSINVPTPNLTVTGNSLSVNGGNTVTLPTAAAQSLAVNGQSLNITGANTITLPSASVVGTGAANVVTIAPNSYSINVPTPNLTVTGNSLSVNGGNTVTLPTAAAQSLAVNGQSLNITGANTITLPSASVVGTGAANVVTIAPNSYSINVPTPNLTVTGNSLSVNGGNTVTLPTAAAQSLAVNGQSLNITGANTITLPSASVIGTGAANVVTLAPNSYSINVPVPNLTVSGNSLSVNGGNTVTLPTAAAQSLAIIGQSVSITGANTITIPSASLIGTGAANVATLGTNSYSIDVPQTNLIQGTGILVTGSYPNYNISATPTLALSGNSLGIVGGNTVTLPSTPAQSLAINGQSLNITGANTITLPSASLIGTGAANVATLGTNSYSINVPIPNLTVSGNSLSVNGGNTVTLPSTPAQSLVLNTNSLSITNGNTITIPSPNFVSTGAANVVTLGINNYSVNVPQTSLINGTNVNVTGAFPSFTINALPTLALSGSSLSISGGNTVTLPSTPVTTLASGSAVTVNNLGTNNFSLVAPATTITPGTNVTVSGAFPNITVNALPSLALTGSNLSISGGNTVTLPAAPTVTGTGAATVTGGPNYTVNVPVPAIAITTLAGTSSVTSSGSNFTINVPSAITPTMNGGGLAVASQTGSALQISVTPYSYTASTGALGSGTNVINITQTLGLTGTTLNSGPGTNSVNLTSFMPWRQAVNAVTLATNADAVGIGTTAPVAKLQVVGAGATNATKAFDVQNSGGTELMTILNGGRVGIGTNSPAEDFQVETGNITAVSIVGGTGFNSNLNFGIPADHFQGGIRYDNTANEMNFRVNGTNNRLLIGSTGNVGVNNNSPTERLDVVGNIRFSGSLMPNNNPGTSGQLLISAGGSSATPTWGSVTYNNSTGVFSIGTNTYAIQPALALSGTTLTSGPSTNSVNLSALSPWRQGASSVTLATSSDFVGIGTNAPGAKLHLVGSGSTGASQAFNVQNSSLTDMFTVLNNGRVGIGTTTPAEELQLQTSSSAALSIISHSASTGSLHFGHSANHFMGAIRYDHSNNSMNFWTNNTNNRMVIDQNGYVGINNANPNTHLDVIGLGRITSSVLVTGYVMDVQNNNTALSAQSSGGLSVTNNGDRTIGNNAVTIQNLTTKSSGSTATKTGLEILSTGTWTASLGGMVNRGLYVNATGGGNGNYSAILMGGQVGIGTLTPTEMLEVVGNIRMTGAFMPANNAGTSGQVLISSGTGAAPSWSTTGLLNNGTANYVPKWNSTTGLSSTSQIYDNGSHVGIGTTTLNQNGTIGRVLTLQSTNSYVTQAAALELVGSSVGLNTAVATVDFNSMNNTGTSANIARILAYRGSAGTNYGDMAFSTNNGTALPTERMRITSTGNVGIGTAAPIKKLSLYGSSGSAYDGPHINFVTTADIYPTMEIFNWSHGEQHILFNSYYEPGAFKSADLNGNFDIANYSNYGLDFRYNDNVTPGTTVNFISGMLLTSDGRVRIGNNATAVTATMQVNGTTRLVDGTQGTDKMLVSDASGNASWVNGSRNTGFSAYATGVGQTALVSNTVQILFSNEEFDHGSDFSSSAYTAPTAGVYHFDASVTFVQNLSGSGRTFLALYKNGILYKYALRDTPTDYYTITLSCTTSLAATDVITVVALQVNGVTMTTLTGSTYTYFSGYRLY